jgi:hypothetical protein
VTTARIFAVLAAALLVAAVGIASLTPMDLSLGEGLLTLAPGLVAWLQAHSAAWVWQWALRPLMQRPPWLVPASLGLICAGVALTFNLGKPSPSRRRRS